MQVIVTKYHGPSGTRGSRISARTTSGLTANVGYNDVLSSDTNHAAAAKKLADKLKWRGVWHGLVLSGNGDRVWTRVDDFSPSFVTTGEG